MNTLAGLAALVLAAVVVVELLRASASLRRRTRLNRAMHELRRPLQSLCLALDAGSRDERAAEGWLEQARAALGELDAEVNGRGRAANLAAVPVAELTRALERRWAPAGVHVDIPTGGTIPAGDPQRLGAALDNLVANAIRHGSGPVSVRALTAPGVARFEVRDGGPPAPQPEPGSSSDPRHGHGLGIVAAVAASHGGELNAPRPDPGGGGTVAALTLPLAGAGGGV